MTFISTWTDARVSELTRLWNEGDSCSIIAAKLGGITRNAVIGKVCRVGLNGRKTVKHLSRTPKSVTIRKPYIRNKTPRSDIQLTVAQPQLRCVEVTPLKTIGLHALTEQTCHYPYNEGAAIVFCGHASFGRTYCYAHEKLCKGVPSERSVRKYPHRLGAQAASARFEATE